MNGLIKQQNNILLIRVNNNEYDVVIHDEETTTIFTFATLAEAEEKFQEVGKEVL